MATKYALPGQNVLEEDYDENYEPTEEEVLEYCKVLDLDPVTERDLLYIAREGIKAPLPKDWKPVEDAAGNIYYFNFVTAQSTWDHPCDEYYREQLYQERSKRMKHKPTKSESARRSGPPSVSREGAPPLGTLPKSMGSPGRQLPPLKGAGLGGRGGLPPVSSLPPLRTAPAGLAPLRVPSGMGGTGSSLGGSLTSTGGSVTDRAGKGGPSGVAGIDLNNVGISNKFEEEDTETEDSDLHMGFKSNFGDINLLDDADLGLKDSESSEDVSKELRKVLDMDESGDESSEGQPERPVAPDPLASSSPLTPLEPTPQSSPRVPRPGAARGRGNSKPALQTGLAVGVSAPKSYATNSNGLDAVKSSHDDRSEEIATLEREHSDAVGRLKDQHVKELHDMQQALTAELESGKATLRSDNEQELAALRRGLASEQLQEEQRLRSEKATAVESVRRKVREEEEEEEARLEEAKMDTLRKLRQQHSQEQDREEKRLKAATEAAITALRKKLQEQQVVEESNLHASNDRELSELREQVAAELEEKRSELNAEHERELQAIGQQWQAQVEGKKSEVGEQHKKELEALAQELSKQHEKAMEDMKRDYEATHSIEELRLRAEASNKQAEENMIAEFATELEARREELETQSQTQLEVLRQQQAAELASLRQEEGSRMKQEQDRLANELQHTLHSMKEEHESKLKQMQAGFEASQKHFQQQQEKQAEELAAVQGECAGRRGQVEQLRQALEEEASQLEAQRGRLAEEQLELAAEEERVKALRSASSQEAKELLKQQRSQLQEAIMKEQRILATLKKSRLSLEEELQQLEKQRNTMTNPQQTTPKELQNEAPLKQHKHNKRKASKQPSKQTPQLVYGSMTAPNEPAQSRQPAGPLPGRTAAEGGPLEVEDIEEDGDSDGGLTSASMQLQELNSSQDTPGVSALGAGETEAIGVVPHGAREGFPGNQEGLHHSLAGEGLLQERIKKQFHRKQHSVKARRSALRQAQKEWKDDMKTFRKGHAHFSEDNNLSLITEIRMKLEQEAAALGELEHKMKASHHLLALQEQSLKSIEGAESESTSVQDSDDQLSCSSVQSQTLNSTAAAQSYLAKLKARLAKTRRPTPHKRHHTSPSAAPTRTVLRSSQGSSSDSSSDTSTPTNSAPTVGRSTHLAPTSRRLIGNERTVRTPSPAFGGPTPQHNSSVAKEEQTASLLQISHQLGRLLDRLDQPGKPPMHVPEHFLDQPGQSSMPLHVHTMDQSRAPPVNVPLHTLDQPEPLHSSGALLSSSHTAATRWATPSRVGGTEPALKHSLGAVSKAVPPVSDPPRLRHVDPDSPIGTTTRQQLRTHTDWLKEFQQSATRLGCRSVGRAHGSVAAPSTAPRSMLTLDNHDNIQLVNV